MNLVTNLSSIGGIGYTFAYRLQNLGLHTVRDLIYHFPFRYDDFSNLTNTLEAQIGEKVTLQGEIWSIRNIYTKTRKILTQAVFNDGNAPIELTWFNSQYLIRSIKVGDRLQISGKISKYKNKLSIIAPVWEKLGAVGSQPSAISNKEPETNTLHTGRLVAVYPETEGLSSKWLRTKINLFLPEVIDQVVDPLPDSIRQEMLTLPEAIKEIHQPQTLKAAQKARDRLGFDELFYIQLATAKTRLEWQKKPLIQPFEVSKQKVAEFIASLPFGLTGAQMRVIGEIGEDLKREQPMNRLVQGEVGSGKTVVAAVIAYIAHSNGLRTMYMAPTEILAFQHQANLKKMLEPFGVTVGLYTGSKKFTKRQESRVKSQGEKTTQNESSRLMTLATSDYPQVIIGTHALLSDKLAVEDVGLIMVDEQQRFGVEQRSVLRNKAKVPHFLTMTATPIPRTVALTLYGDLDLSIIDELPKGRQEIKTHVVPKKKRADAYVFLHKRVKEGDQVYIITPLIELSETIVSAKAAIHEFERLQKEIFPDLRLGLLHGRLKPKEKDEVLQQFKNHQLDILVSTSVVEVGVDIPNATIMLIENAERFGLAQLHQLRGRVGRGVKQSYCLLFSGVEEKETYNRLKNLETTSDGLKLAELDLKIRGGGQIFGKEQSGRFELKIASFSDLELIEKTRSAAKKLLAEDPKLEKHQLIAQELSKIAAQAAPD